MDLVRDFIADSKDSSQTLDVARELLEAAFADRADCDRLLARHARHWELGRLAMVDRNILRLAAYELRFDRAPPKVVITEAIRLAREFSTAESPRFINGVLDAVSREVTANAQKAGTDAQDTGAPQQWTPTDAENKEDVCS